MCPELRPEGSCGVQESWLKLEMGLRSKARLQSPDPEPIFPTARGCAGLGLGLKRVFRGEISILSYLLQKLRSSYWGEGQETVWLHQAPTLSPGTGLV